MKSSNPCNPPSQIFLEILPAVHLSMSVQNTNFQSDTVCTFGFMADQRSWLPGGQKLHFHLTAFCKNCIFLRTLCQIWNVKLKLCSLLNFRVLNQNLMVKRDEWRCKLCYFDVSVRFKISKNCQKWSITNGILRM